MTINERVRILRKKLGLNQTEFGHRIAVAQGYLTNIENGRRDVTEKVIKLICLQFRVNEEWLRTGKGEMFVKNDNTLVAQLAKQYNLDDFGCRFIETYSRLPEAQRDVIKKFAYSVIAGRNADMEISAELSPVSNESHGLTESEIDAEVDSYRQELEIEKSIQTSSASHDGKKTG